MENKYTGFLKSRRTLYEKRDKCPLVGDAPGLHFINTVYRREADRKDYLKNYDCFLDWAYDAGIVDEDTYNMLCFESYCYYPEAEMAFEQVISFRECFRDLVICLMDCVAPQPEAIGTFNYYFGEAKKHRSLNMNGFGMFDTWVDTTEQIAFPLWKITEQARDFLAGADGKFIKKCKCGNLYIDNSRNGGRRWCSQASCGAAHWSKEYYKRKKELAI